MSCNNTKLTLTGSIEMFKKVTGSISSQIKLTGSILSEIKLQGSVAYFITSLSAKMNIYPIVKITAISIVSRVINNLKINPIVNVYTRTMTRKNAKTNIIDTVKIYIKTTTRKNAKAVIYFTPRIGSINVLKILKILTLGQIKTKTLKEITYTDGISCSILKKGITNLNPVVNLSTTATLIRKTKLGDIKSDTLGVIKLDTLQQLIEYEV